MHSTKHTGENGEDGRKGINLDNVKKTFLSKKIKIPLQAFCKESGRQPEKLKEAAPRNRLQFFMHV